MTSRNFLCNNISGAPATSLPLSGFSVVYWKDGSNITGSVNTVSEIADGYYKVTVSNEPLGELALRLKYTDTSYSIAPDSWEWTKESTYTEDDVYGRIIVATSSTSLPVVPSQRFIITTLNVKEHDDIVETVQVPARFRPLTDWTSITIKAYPAARLLDPSTPALSGTYSATVIDDVDGVVDIVIGKDVVNSVVPSGAPSALIYADLQGIDGDGYTRTMMQFNITVNRDFNQ